jgi:hypothetical protein
MKQVCLALLCLLCAACTRFENPILGEKGPAFDEALVGHWSAEKDDSRFEVVITRNGDEGKVEYKSTEPGKEPETGATRLITARIERHDFGSVVDADDKAKSWRFFRYELSAPNKLTIYLPDEDFWTGAVKNKQVTGTIDGHQESVPAEGVKLLSTVVTASSEELRTLVQGYGPVIFKDEPVVELTRQ